MFLKKAANRQLISSAMRFWKCDFDKMKPPLKRDNGYLTAILDVVSSDDSRPARSLGSCDFSMMLKWCARGHWLGDTIESFRPHCSCPELMCNMM